MVLDVEANVGEPSLAQQSGDPDSIIVPFPELDNHVDLTSFEEGEPSAEKVSESETEGASVSRAEEVPSSDQAPASEESSPPTVPVRVLDDYRSALLHRDMEAFHRLHARYRREIRAAWQEEDRRRAEAAQSAGAALTPEEITLVDTLIADPQRIIEYEQSAPRAVDLFHAVQAWKAQVGLPRTMSYSDALRWYQTQQMQAHVAELSSEIDVDTLFARYQRDPRWEHFTEQERDELDPTHPRYANMTRAQASLALAEHFGRLAARADARQRAAPHVARLRQQQAAANAVVSAAAASPPPTPAGTPPTPRDFDTVVSNFIRDPNNPQFREAYIAMRRERFGWE